MIRVGELCAGYGGISLGLEQVLGEIELAFVADNDKGASKILAHHFPGVPNLGDISETDWARVAPVDVLAAGFPCQDVSHAGLRRGLRRGNRSGVWASVAQAIDVLRPPMVILENVEGLLSAKADSRMEHCPWCLGNGDPKLAVRALGTVLGDLAEIGFDAEWCGVSASEAGAPHRRRRIFILAWPRDAVPGGDGREGDPLAGFRLLAEPGERGQRRAAPQARGGRGERAAAPDAERVGLEGVRGNAGPVPAEPWEGDRPQARRRGPVRGGDDAAEDPDVTARGERRVPGPGEAEGRWSRAHAGRRGELLAAYGGGTRLREFPGIVPGKEEPAGGDVADDHGGERDDTDWGPYEPAIRRWERILGRAAPRPVEPGRTGKPRLSARFAEWMMGLPDGWVTGVPATTRNDHLRAIGNGVVPGQAALAVRALLDAVREDSPTASG